MSAQVEPIGRVLIAVGILIAGLGVVLVFGSRVPLLGHLPGDITIHRGDVTIFLPLGTMLLLSLAASVLLSLFGRR